MIDISALKPDACCLECLSTHQNMLHLLRVTQDWGAAWVECCCTNQIGIVRALRHSSDDDMSHRHFPCLCYVAASGYLLLCKQLLVHYTHSAAMSARLWPSAPFTHTLCPAATKRLIWIGSRCTGNEAVMKLWSG